MNNNNTTNSGMYNIYGYPPMNNNMMHHQHMNTLHSMNMHPNNNMPYNNMIPILYPNNNMIPINMPQSLFFNPLSSHLYNANMMPTNTMDASTMQPHNIPYNNKHNTTHKKEYNSNNRDSNSNKEYNKYKDNRDNNRDTRDYTRDREERGSRDNTRDNRDNTRDKYMTNNTSNRRESREREKGRYNKYRDNNSNRHNDRYDDKRFNNKFNDNDKKYTNKYRDRDDNDSSNNHRYNNNRYDDRDSNRYNNNKRDVHYMIINKPIDHIEGNVISKDRSVNYTCIDSNVPRKANIIDMVKYKISKYFTNDVVIENEDKIEEDANIGLSDEEDLYYLTFKRRYYNEYIVCSVCYKEGIMDINIIGHNDKRCPERFKNVCWMCLGNHNKEDCINIACFRCNGSGHKNSNCPLKDSSGFPVCPKCKKRSHSEKDCSMISLSFVKAAADLSDVLCYLCGDRGHAASIHLSIQPSIQPIDTVDQRIMSDESIGDVNNMMEDNEEYLWQKSPHSEEADDVPVLYEPKVSIHRRNSDDILHTLEGDT